jgi:hypothetical protein
MLYHLPLHSIQLVWNVGIGIIMQQNDAIIEFNLTFVLDFGSRF